MAGLKAKASYGFLYSTRALAGSVQIRVTAQGQQLLRKTLHAGDPDVYTQFGVPSDGDAQLEVQASGFKGEYRLELTEWPASRLLRRGPAHTWNQASPMDLGTTVFASADEEEYVPLRGAASKQTDWYRFEFAEASPKLVFFQIDLMERDNLPVDVALFRILNGKPEEFLDGADPVTPPHETQALPGNKFTTRILKDKGEYFVQVRANHPEYKLRTRVYNPPPYRDPQEAVRTAVDFIIGAGDSWHANTPRRGGVFDRVASVHQETSLCVACHATHFPLRAQLIAAKNGYPIVQRQQVQFLTERFYNNPRPFYGFEKEGATWARVISAPANVLSRMSYLANLFEAQVSGEQRPEFHRGINEYLKLYYRERDALPPDETNGNTPIVSNFEVAWYSWSVSNDAKIPDLVAQGEVKNVIDLCYQTQALADMDPVKYREQIRANADRILALQRPDGQWSMRFEADQAEVEFQTGHALWALYAAGVPRDNPQVAKGLAYLLGRQQSFGGWMDPLQSFENFRTPFRETQMAILALSSYYPMGPRAKGWDAPKLGALSADPVKLLQELDGVWDAQSPTVLASIRKQTSASDALIRQAAVEALGRLGDPGSLDLVSQRLGDDSKLVQRTAAWALRQIYSRHPETSARYLTAALSSKDDRTRWGATRVFATHFAELARRPEFAEALQFRLTDSNPAVQMQAVKGLWQLWFWTGDDGVRGRIEDGLLASLSEPQHPWVEQNLRAAIYNIADENVRYLYNNWVPRISRAGERDRAIEGRLRIDARLAAKFATSLDRGDDSQKKLLLAALTEYPLRRGDVYNLDADLSAPAPPVYSRIGNDIEQIVFFGESAERMAKSLAPLVDSRDPELRRLARNASLLVREMKFSDVNRLAGARGPAVAALTEKVDLLKPPKPAPTTVTSTGGAPMKARTAKLDEPYFRARVQRILEKKGADGNACVQCHTTHTLFNATWSTVMNVVNTDDPEKSLILVKPTSSSEKEGLVGAVAHGGGVRWGKNSPEYLTILDWIRGAKE